MVAPVKHDAWFMFHSLQCTMVNPFVAGSSVLFTFIEIMETILKKLLERVNNLWEGVRESFQIKWLRKLLNRSEQKHDQAPFWDQNAGYFNKANNAILFYSGEKKTASKSSTNALNFVLTPSKIPTCTSQENLLQICHICIYYHRAKPNLKSPS